MRARILAAGAALVMSLTHAANAAVWGFGDSNLDNGWFTVAPYSGEIAYDTYLQQASLYGVGKQTNNPGPMSIEVLAASLGLTAFPANKPNGTNFAVSGAKNVDPNTTTNGGFPNAVPTVTQFGNFLATRKIGANDVFLVDSGANDVNYALTLNPTDQQAYLQQKATALARAIAALQKKGGATHLIVVNQPESFGSAAAQSARHVYDAALKSSLDSLGVIYAWGDRNRVRQDIVDDTLHHASAKFHMLYVDNSDPDVACPRSGFSSDWAILCSPDSPVSNPRSFAQQTLFADNGHWASNGQKILGSYYYCLVKAHWPSLIPPSPLPPVIARIPAPPYGCGAFSEFAPPPPPPL
jgi:phospholipase/lecithinase/hemolysin